MKNKLGYNPLVMELAWPPNSLVRFEEFLNSSFFDSIDFGHAIDVKPLEKDSSGNQTFRITFNNVYEAYQFGWRWYSFANERKPA
jgi:hypothetical protein